MKQISKKKIQLTGIILSALFGVGCGGGGANGDGGDPPPPPPNTAPVAVAGSDLTVSRNFTVNLDAGGSSDAEDDTLTFTWTQTAGPDVTGGTGTLNGEAPAFAAPGEVDTIMFELVVNDGVADSAPDMVMINVLEDVNVAYFVDGDNGSDVDGNGSSATPFASIAKALCEVTADQQDIYVMTRTASQAYDETVDPCPDPARGTEQILTIPTGTSLYGGYGANWVRDASGNPALVDTSYHGFRFIDVNINAWFSGFDVQTADAADPDSNVYAIYAVGGSASLYVLDNTLTAGNVGFGNSANPGSSHGLLVALMEGANIERNFISAGFGGDGLDVGNIFSTEAPSGSKGGNANGTSAGGGGDGKGPSDNDGGGGGGPGFSGGTNGSKGGNGAGPAGLGGCGGGQSSGGNNCIGESISGDHGRVGQNGGKGGGGSGGLGGSGAGFIEAFIDGGAFAHFNPGSGVTGDRGLDGGGAGGGGGGEANTGVNGGAGGGGGGAGSGGQGGPKGSGGGASISLFIATVNSSLINQNTIISGLGGNGATGGQGQVGGDGGASGAGGDGAIGFLGCCHAGDGGNGGSGGKGGTGGRGGAGGGGPSYGIAIGDNIAPSISNNDIISSEAGLGGFGGNAGKGGTGGNSYSVFDNDINDGFIPALINNTLVFGLPGDGGGTTDINTGSVGSAGQSGTTNW